MTIAMTIATRFVLLPQVMYQVVDRARPIMEAAASAGFQHVASGPMEQCLLDIGCQKVKLKHERAAALIHAYKDPVKQIVQFHPANRSDFATGTHLQDLVEA